jgi:hypothetical protein
MSRLFSTLACLVLLCAQIALGATAAEAAGIGGHLGGMRKTFRERLQGGHNPHVGVGAGAQAPSQLSPNTRSIQLDTTGESTAIKSPK